jgi:hypothetical protein
MEDSQFHSALKLEISETILDPNHPRVEVDISSDYI